MPDYLPRREGDRVAWAGRLAGKLVAQPGDYGVSVEQAEAYALLQAEVAAVWRTCQMPSTRTRPAVQAKDTAMKALIAQTRGLVRQLRGYLMQTGQEAVRGTRLAGIGLRVPSDSRRVLRVPSRVPGVWLEPLFNGRIEVRVQDPAHPYRTAKPRGVMGLVALGQVYSQQTGRWSPQSFLRNSARMRFTVEYPNGAAAGDRLAVTVRWCSAACELGPGSTPAELELPPRYAVRYDNVGQRAA